MGLPKQTRDRWKQLRPTLLTSTSGRLPPANPTGFNGPSIVIVDGNTSLHPMFDKGNRVTLVDMAQGFMEYFLSLQQHYTSKDNQLAVIHIVFDHHEGNVAGVEHRGTRFLAPTKNRVKMPSKEYDDVPLFSEENEEEKAGEEEVFNLALDDEKTKLQLDQERKREFMDADTDPDYKEALEAKFRLPGVERMRMHWGKLMESRALRDDIWQKVLRCIELFDRETRGSFSHALKVPITVRHGPHPVMVLNPSRVRPPSSRRRVLLSRLHDMPDGISWVPLDYSQFGWFAESDKTIQRMTHDLALKHPDSQIIVHSVDTDFLLYNFLVYFPLWQKRLFRGKVVLANHLLMSDRLGNKLAYTNWCDIVEMIALVFQSCRMSVLEFLVLTVLGGTDFFNGSKLDDAASMANREALAHNREVKKKKKEDPNFQGKMKQTTTNYKVAFWDEKNHAIFESYIAGREKTLVAITPAGDEGAQPGIGTDKYKKQSLFQKVRNIAMRGIEPQKKIVFTSDRYLTIYENVRYALAKTSIIEAGDEDPAFFLDDIA